MKSDVTWLQNQRSDGAVKSWLPWAQAGWCRKVNRFRALQEKKNVYFWLILSNIEKEITSVQCFHLICYTFFTQGFQYVMLCYVLSIIYWTLGYKHRLHKSGYSFLSAPSRLHLSSECPLGTLSHLDRCDTVSLLTDPFGFLASLLVAFFTVITVYRVFLTL